MWERTLQDLIRGLRANKKDDAKFIAQAVDEIRQEIRSKDMELKAGAVLKLTYVRPTLSRKLRASNAIMKS
jgi:AP-3 complex subunit delta-1